MVKYNAFKQNFTLQCTVSALGNDKVENDQPPEAANVLYWFEKVHYLLTAEN